MHRLWEYFLNLHTIHPQKVYNDTAKGCNLIGLFHGHLTVVLKINLRVKYGENWAGLLLEITGFRYLSRKSCSSRLFYGSYHVLDWITLRGLTILLYYTYLFFSFFKNFNFFFFFMIDIFWKRKRDKNRHFFKETAAHFQEYRTVHVKF